MRDAELRQALRLKVARRLAEAGRRSINLHEVAAALGVSERTLRNWRRFGELELKQGRPRHNEVAHKYARGLVYALMKKHGAPGWRKIAAELKDQVPTRLVQRYVACYKEEMRPKKVVRSKAQVKGKNIIWAVDGAFLKREKRREHQVIKDRGSQKVLTVKDVCSKGAEVVAVLEGLRLESGLPLVLSSDNGSAYKSRELCSYLERWQVVHLRSLPRTPQHNGAVERSIRELKEVSTVEGIELLDACGIVNGRPRKYETGWASADVMYEKMNVQYNEMERVDFFRACADKMKASCERRMTVRQRRLYEREVILDELKVRGYINRWKLEDKCN